MKYWWQRFDQQNSASAQHAGTHDEQGQDALPKHFVTGEVIRVLHLCSPDFSCDEDKAALSPGNRDENELHFDDRDRDVACRRSIHA